MNNVSKLVEQARNGDESAFNELYNNSYKMVYLTCMSHLRNPEDAMDATQDTFLAVYKNLSTLNDSNAFYGWVKSVAVNTSLHKLRSIKNDVSFDDAVENEQFDLSDDIQMLPDTYVFNEEQRNILLGIIKENLSEVQYQTIVLFYFDHMPINYIASLMKCPEGTVKTRLMKSKVKIKEGIEAYENNTGDRIVAAAGVIPSIAMLLKTSSESIPVTIRPFRYKLGMGASATGNLGAEATKNVASEVASGVASGASKGTAKFLGLKIAAIVAAVGVIGTAGFFVVKSLLDNTDKNDRRNKVEDTNEVEASNETIVESEAGIEEVISETEPTSVVFPVNYDFNKFWGYEYEMQLIVNSDIMSEVVDPESGVVCTHYSLDVEDTGEGYLIGISRALYPVAIQTEEYRDFLSGAVDRNSRTQIDDTHFQFGINSSANTFTVLDETYTLIEYTESDQGRDEAVYVDTKGESHYVYNSLADNMIQGKAGIYFAMILSDVDEVYDDTMYIYIPYGSEYDNVLQSCANPDSEYESAGFTGLLYVKFMEDGTVELLAAM